MISDYKRLTTRRREEHTIAMDPQQRTILLPLIECVTPRKPFCCAVVLAVTRGVMVDGRIRSREPYSKLLTRLVPCAKVSAKTIDGDNVVK
jgi:hypothetical protein